jgi:hypothetical protein
MDTVDPSDPAAAIKHVRELASTGSLRITQHAQQEMVHDAVSLDDVLAVIANGNVLENYPTHKRGACCLVHGCTNVGRDLHVVCTSSNPMLIIITVYEPKPPVWPTATTRRSKP